MFDESSLKKVWHIFLNALPILVMIVLIPLISNDIVLTMAYVIVIVFALMIERKKNDIRVMIFGFIIMIVCEWIFISTGVETFQRNSLFGIMPLWLPFLWAYGFVAIKRSIEVINNQALK
jgi:hypothetical protein